VAHDESYLKTDNDLIQVRDFRVIKVNR